MLIKPCVYCTDCIAEAASILCPDIKGQFIKMSQFVLIIGHICSPLLTSFKLSDGKKVLPTPNLQPRKLLASR